MPYLSVRIAAEESAELAQGLVSMLMKHTGESLGKRADVTSIAVEFIPPQRWFVGGERVSEVGGVTFYLEIKVTAGTNTKAEKSRYVERVFADFEAILGPITPASYIVIHDLAADSWGYQGRTQEFRFIQAQSL